MSTTPLVRAVRRAVEIRGRGVYVVTIAAAGVELRPRGRRFRVLVPWRDVLDRGERLAAELLRQQRLERKAALRSKRR
jgi:hypothetical protein